MASFNDYTHQESVVQAVQLSNETYKSVVEALGHELASGLLASFQATWNSSDRCYDIVFRYKDSTTDSSLVTGDYLVQLNTARYVVFDKETFEADYLPTYKDEAAMPKNPQTPMEAMVTFIKKYFPDSGITDVGDLTSANLGQVLEGLKDWYNADTDQFTIRFDHCGIVDPTGLADLFAAFPKASFIKDTTTYKLSFVNGGVTESDANTENNLFNYAGLQILLGEFNKIDSAYAKKLVDLDFSSQDSIAPSAVANSVTDVQWSSWCQDVMSVTGIISTGYIHR